MNSLGLKLQTLWSSRGSDPIRPTQLQIFYAFSQLSEKVKYELLIETLVFSHQLTKFNDLIANKEMSGMGL